MESITMERPKSTISRSDSAIERRISDLVDGCEAAAHDIGNLSGKDQGEAFELRLIRDRLLSLVAAVKGVQS